MTLSAAALLTLLPGCVTTGSDRLIPEWPVGGVPVYEELAELCGPILEDCPHMADWLVRLDQFKSRLDIANQ